MGGRTGRRLLAGSLVLLVTALLLAFAPTVAVAQAGPCQVHNLTHPASYGGNGAAFTVAISAARTGDHLTVDGTCAGHYVLGKSLTIEGSSSATLDGTNSGTVVKVRHGQTVTVSGLIITGGGQGGVVNEGTLTIYGSSVSSNRGSTGGGIANAGKLTVDASSISGNRASVAGGGIANMGTLHLSGSSVDNNFAHDLGGGIYDTGTLRISTSSLRANTTGAAGRGGGLDVAGGSVVIGRSDISGNKARGEGGGVAIRPGHVTIKDSGVSTNTSGAHGGGISVNGSDGAASLTLDSDGVTNNTAHLRGGGLYVVGDGRATITNSGFRGNVPNDCTGVSCP